MICFWSIFCSFYLLYHLIIQILPISYQKPYLTHQITFLLASDYSPFFLSTGSHNEINIYYDMFKIRSFFFQNYISCNIKCHIQIAQRCLLQVDNNSLTIYTCSFIYLFIFLFIVSCSFNWESFYSIVHLLILQVLISYFLKHLQLRC